MSDQPSIPSSVDTSGDLSRNSRLTRGAAHKGNVGTPEYAPSYRPENHRQHEQEGSNTNPLKCALVLGTLSECGKIEYRVGRFLNAPQLDAGISAPEVMLHCFGGSSVYHDRNEAVLVATNRFPDNSGIKVFTRPIAFPPRSKPF